MNGRWRSCLLETQLANVGSALARPSPGLSFLCESPDMASRSGAGWAAWNDSRMRVGSDSRRTARYRALQSWYRETILKVPPGLDRNGRKVASLLPTEAVERNPGLNFITPEATGYVAERADAVLSSGGTLDKDRLTRNMLSSMPLCFNIFGSLRGKRELKGLLSRVFGIDVQTIDVVECEWAPPKTPHLNDRTAFDAFVSYRDSAERKCFLAIETKYTEPFSQKEYDSELYRHVTSGSGHFRSGASDRLVGRTTNQMWRMTMLAATMLQTEDHDMGSVAVLCLGDDSHARAAVDGVRREVLDDGFVKLVSFEELAEAATSFEALGRWAKDFRQRYLDLTPVMPP